MRRVLFDVLEINIAVSLVILLVCLFEKKLCKRYGAGCLKIVWVILAIRLLIPYNFSLPFTEIRLFSVPGFEQEESVNVEVPSFDTTDIPESSQLPTVDLTDMNAQKVEPVPKTNVETENAVKQPEASGISPVQTQEPSVHAQLMFTDYDLAQKPIKVNTFSYSTLFAHLWLIGTAAGLCYFIVCSVSFYKQYNRSLHRLSDTGMLKKVNEIQEEMIGQKRIEVYESSAISSPMLIGLLHTKLVFPTSPKQWQEKELEYIVSHEIWHYRNKDLWLKLLLLFVWCLNWWNPFILLMKRKCFFYMELACDECVLVELEKDARGEYAEMLLGFAGRRNPVSAFSTNFGSGKKRLKQRLDYALETRKHKKGTVTILLICLLVICAGLFISCGYKPEEVDKEKTGVEQTEETEEVKDSIIADTVDMMKTEDPVENTPIEFTYNHDYNRGVRCHEGYIYYVKKDGVYRMKEDGTGEEQLFGNSYIYRRGIDLYGDYLYFIGSIMRGEQEESTIYRMNLETMEIVDALAAFSNSFPRMGKITIYEDCLYVIEGAGWIGFQLSQTGDIVSRLEEDDNYLFKEDNEYNLLTDKLWSETTYQSEEWWDIQNKLNEHYVSASDAAACEKLLNGKRILSIYKDEALWSAYMRHEDGTKEYLCDVADCFPIIITATGMYYSPDLDGAVYYLDFETKEKSLFLEKPKDLREIWLVNYDKEYIYYAKEAPWLEETSEEGDRLMRIPRQGGDSEVVYELDKNFRSETLWRQCAIVGDYLYLNEEWIKLSPQTD